MVSLYVVYMYIYETYVNNFNFKIFVSNLSFNARAFFQNIFLNLSHFPFKYSFTYLHYKSKWIRVHTNVCAFDIANVIYSYNYYIIVIKISKRMATCLKITYFPFFFFVYAEMHFAGTQFGYYLWSAMFDWRK